MRRRGLSLGVSRFVAGHSLDETRDVVERLEGSGMLAILDLLGEFIDSREGAEAMTQRILADIPVLARMSSSPAMSVKPTQLGLALGADLALENARRIALRAREGGVAICLDMENHPHVDGTLALYLALHEEGFQNVSTVLQSYLRRSQDDLETLTRLVPAPEVRIVKGAYREPATVAYQDKATVDQKFQALVLRLLEAGGKVNVATHDERLLSRLAGPLHSAGVGSDRYEYQLLYGVKPRLQRELLEAGHPVRVYVPFGDDWYGYFSRRLAERPANLMFVLRGLLG